MIFDRKYPNVDDTVIKLIKYPKKPITCQRAINKHSGFLNYPSLLAVPGVLDKFKMSNVDFTILKEQIFDVPLPFLSYICNNSGKLVLIENIDSNTV